MIRLNVQYIFSVVVSVFEDH